MTKTSVIVTALSCLLLGMTGCVSQKHADDIELAYQKSQEQIVELQARIAELEQQITLLQQQNRDQTVQYDALVQERNGLQAKMDELTGQVDSLTQEKLSLLDRIAKLESRGIDAKLPKELEDALKRFADQHAGLATYDPATGSVKFDSDLTFPLGSDALSAEARASLGQLATILNSSAAQPYEVRVVGHTDTVRISKPSTKTKHPTNWHLSVHRAIAVRDALEGAGIKETRLQVAGYGPYRPVVQNTRGGAKENRRVEIFLAPRTAVNDQFLTPVGGAAPAPTGTDTAPPVNDAIFK